MEKVSLREINKLAIPAILAGLSEPIISIADTAVLGHFANDEDVLASLGAATGFYLAIVWILAQSKSAISALVSRHLGSNRISFVKTLVPQSIWLYIILGVLFYVLTVPFISDIMSLQNLEGQTRIDAENYYSIRALGFPLILATFTIFGVYRGLQNTLWAMTISITGALINVGLDYAFVHGIDGIIKPMHIEGAAWASLISQGTMFLMAIVFLYRRTPFTLYPGKKLSPFIKEFIQLTVNLFARTIMLNLAILLAIRTANDYGDQYGAAHQIGWQIWIFSAFFIDGYSNAGNAISGKLLGQNNFQTMKRLVFDVLKYNLIISIILSLIFLSLYPILGDLFTNDQFQIKLFKQFLWIILLIIPVNAIAFSLDGVFKGLGEARFLRNVLVIATVLGFIPTLLISSNLEMGLQGIWMAFGVWMLFRSILPFTHFLKMVNSKIKESNR